MHHPEFPEPMGVFRCVERPTYEGLVMDQVNAARGDTAPTLDDLFGQGDVWTVD